MRAYHRLVGDMPNRGYGGVIKTPGFPTAQAVIDCGSPRLSELDPGVKPAMEGALRLQAAAWELLQVRYGVPVLVSSAQLWDGVSRAHSYTDMVMADASAEGRENAVSAGDLLRFDGFVSRQAFWQMSADTSALPAGDWTLADADALKGDGLFPDVRGEALERILARWWHAASMQTFGPWQSDKREQFTYAASRQDALSALMEPPTSISGVLNDDASYDGLIRAAKAFLYMILDSLPREAQGVASVSAGVSPGSYGRFSHAALRLMLPPYSDEATFDLRTGRMPDASADELALIRLIRAEGLDAVPFLKTMRETIGPAASDRLAADWQVLSCLHGLREKRDSHALVRLWYRLYCLLRDRHMDDGISDMELWCSELMREVDACVLEKLEYDQRVLQADDTLQSFFWRKALCVCEQDVRADRLADLTACCQTPDNLHYFLPTLIQATVKTDSQARSARLPLARTLARFYADGSIDEEHLRVLMGRDALLRHDGLRQTVNDFIGGELAAYGRGERDAWPNAQDDYCLYLMPLAQHFAHTDADMAQLLRSVVSGKGQRLLTAQECSFVNSFLAKLDAPREAQEILCDYLTHACRTLPEGDLSALAETAKALDIVPLKTVADLLGADDRLSVPQLSCIYQLMTRCPGGHTGEAALAAIRGYAQHVLLSLDAPLLTQECTFIRAACAPIADEVGAYLARLIAAGRSADAMRIWQMTQLGEAAAARQLLASRARLDGEQLAALSALMDRLPPASLAPQIAAYARDVLLAGDELLREDEIALLNRLAGEDGAPALDAYFRAAHARHGAASLMPAAHALELDLTDAALALIADARAASRPMDEGDLALVLGVMTAHAPASRAANVCAAAANAAHALAEEAIKREQPDSLLPWLTQVHAALPENSPARAHLSNTVLPGYLIAWHIQTSRQPDEAAFAWLDALTPDAFAPHRDGAAHLYDQLLALQVLTEPGAEQAYRLLQRIGQLDDAVPALRRFACGLLTRQLTAAWQTQPYRAAIESVLRTLPDSTLTADDLTAGDPQLHTAARDKARTEAAVLREPAAFTLRYQEAFPPHARDLQAIWQGELRAAFEAGYDAMYQACRSDEDLRALDHAQRTLKATVRETASFRRQAALGQLGDAFAALAARSTAAPADAWAMVSTTLAQLTAAGCYARDSYGVTAMTFKELPGAQGDLPFPAALALRSLSSIPAGGTKPDWRKVFDALLPGWTDMAQRPFAPANLPLLQTVSALVRSLMDRAQPEGFGEALVQFLRRDPDMAPLMDALFRDKKIHSYLHPDVIAAITGTKGGTKDE